MWDRTETCGKCLGLDEGAGSFLSENFSGWKCHLAHTDSWLDSWCFEPSQPQRITSGLKTDLQSISRLFISQVITPQNSFT